jgi:hypothetical protein
MVVVVVVACLVLTLAARLVFSLLVRFFDHSPTVRRFQTPLDKSKSRRESSLDSHGISRSGRGHF